MSDLTDMKMEQPVPHVSIDIAQPYGEKSGGASEEPEVSLNGDGDIVSHDHHLNEDAEALHSFLLAQSAIPPSYVVDIVGSHEEHKTRTIVNTVNGQTTTQIEHYTERVVDFDFSIDLTSYIVQGPHFWSYSDADPTHRGLMVRQVNDMTTVGFRAATSKEIDAFKAVQEASVDAGVTPWQAPNGSLRVEPLASSMTLRQWADEYVESPKQLKEFIFEKSVYGWSPSKLKPAIAHAIASTSYKGSVHSTFTLSSHRITIRPDNRLSRILSSTLYTVLLWIFLIYPFIWLWKRFSGGGGGKWEVGGAAYGLVQLEPLDGPRDSSAPLLNFAGQDPRVHQQRVIETPQGPQKLMGLREGEWFREWEGAIRHCAVKRLKHHKPFKHLSEAPQDPAAALNGYVQANAHFTALNGFS